MTQEYSQIQLYKEVKNISQKINKLEAEMRLVIKKIDKQENGLDKGLKELRLGKGKIYKSAKEWSAAMKKA